MSARAARRKGRVKIRWSAGHPANIVEVPDRATNRRCRGLANKGIKLPRYQIN